MKYDEFISAVKDQANVDSKEEAERTAFEVLRTLGERITGGEADDLYAQLPEPLKTKLMAHVRPDEPAHPMSADEYVARVADVLGVDTEEAAARVRGVFEVVRQAVTPGEIDDVLSQLDKSYRRLFAMSAS